MIEKEYVLARNAAYLGAAIHAVSELVPGIDDVVTTEKKQKLLRMLYDMQETAFAKLDTEPSKDVTK